MQIHQILNYSYPQYKRLIFETYFCYCDIYARDQKDLQQLLANKALGEWFRKEYKILEDEFLYEVTPYIGQVDHKMIRDIYDKKTAEIVNFFSRPLMEQARKMVAQKNAYER